jgi:hypothetical protein
VGTNGRLDDDIGEARTNGATAAGERDKGSRCEGIVEWHVSIGKRVGTTAGNGEERSGRAKTTASSSAAPHEQN